MAGTNCTHHWLIEPPNESKSKGRCLRCRRERIFDNVASGQYERDQFTADVSSRRPRASIEREAVELADEAM